MAHRHALLVHCRSLEIYVWLPFRIAARSAWERSSFAKGPSVAGATCAIESRTRGQLPTNFFVILVALRYELRMSRIRPIFRELRCSLSQLNGATSRVISSTSGTRDDGSSGKPGWMPGWIRSKLPAALGGEREAISEMENLTLDGTRDCQRRTTNSRRTLVDISFSLGIISC